MGLEAEADCSTCERSLETVLDMAWELPLEEKLASRLTDERAGADGQVGGNGLAGGVEPLDELCLGSILRSGANWLMRCSRRLSKSVK